MIEINSVVSVIVTTFNRKKYLKETVESILNQSYKNFELIIVDNYSDYDFLSHIKSFNDERIRSFQNSNDGLIAVNRNFGIEKAKGEYIAFCDDDDLWVHNKLEKQLEYFKTDEIIGIGSEVTKFGNLRYTYNQSLNKKTKKKLTYKDLLVGESVALSSLIVKKNKIRYSEDYKLAFVEDWDYQIKLTKTGKNIIKIPDKLINYRIPPFTNDYPKKAENMINVLQKYQNELPLQEVNYLKKKYFYYLALRNLKVGNKDEAISCLKKSDNYEASTFFIRILIFFFPRYILLLSMRLYYIIRSL